jgi:hypothetical protein
MKTWLLRALVLALLTSCSNVDVSDYSSSEPKLDLREFFNGELRAYGLLQDRAGKMTRRFSATLQGSWQGEQGTLVEHFIFDDGSEQDRTWHLQHLGNGQYQGTADDVIGTAIGNIGGSVLQWEYQLLVPWRDTQLAVTLDDWLYLIDQQHLLNKTELRKFGLRVGELTLVIEKVQ